MEVAPRGGEDQALMVRCLKSVDGCVGAAGECEGYLAGHAHRDIPKHEVVVQHCYTEQEKKHHTLATALQPSTHGDEELAVSLNNRGRGLKTARANTRRAPACPTTQTYHCSGSAGPPPHFQWLPRQTQVLACSRW